MSRTSTRALQRPRGEPAPPYTFFTEAGEVLLYALGPGRGRRGKLEKRILEELLRGILTLADLARILGRTPPTMFKALQRLERKGLVISLRATGRTLHGSPVLRRFYALNPETCLVTHRVPNLTLDRLREEADEAQLRGLLRQRLYEGAAKLSSHDLVKRSQGRQLLGQVRDAAQAALDAADPRLKWRTRHPTTT